MGRCRALRTHAPRVRATLRNGAQSSVVCANLQQRVLAAAPVVQRAEDRSTMVSAAVAGPASAGAWGAPLLHLQNDVLMPECKLFFSARPAVLPLPPPAAADIAHIAHSTPVEAWASEVATYNTSAVATCNAFKRARRATSGEMPLKTRLRAANTHLFLRCCSSCPTVQASAQNKQRSLLAPQHARPHCCCACDAYSGSGRGVIPWCPCFR